MLPGSRSLPRAASWRTFRPKTATSGSSFPPRAWCFLAICTPTSSPPAGRRTRSGIPGTSPARPGGRAVDPGLPSRHAWFPLPPARTPPARFGSHPPVVARLRSSPRAVSSRWQGSSRCRGHSITPVRWPGPPPTAGCCSGRWPGRIGARRRPHSMPHRPTGCRSARRRGRWPAFDWPSLRASRRSSSTPMSPPDSRSRSTPVGVSAPHSSSLRHLRRGPTSVAASASSAMSGTTSSTCWRQNSSSTTDVSTRQRDRYRPSLREWVEEGERRAVSGETYVAAQARRRQLTRVWADWLDEHRVAAVIEPDDPRRGSATR